MPTPYSSLNVAIESFKGVNLTAAPDQLREGEWVYAQNASTSIVGQLSTRAGSTLVGPPTGIAAPVHSIFFLSDPVSAYPTTIYLYVLGIGTSIYGWSGGATWNVLATGFSGNPLTGVIYRLQGTGQPWLIIGDSNKMVKIGWYAGAWTVFQLGITPSADAADVIILPDPLTLLIQSFNNFNAEWVLTGTSSSSPNGAAITTATRAGDLVTINTGGSNNFVADLLCFVFDTPDTSFLGNFAISDILSSTEFTYTQYGADATTGGGSSEVYAGYSFTMNSGATGTFSGPQAINLAQIDGNPSQDSDSIYCWINIDNIAHATDVQLLFDIDPESVLAGALTAEAFTTNYYYGSVFSQLANGWNLVSLPKSSFTRVGQGTYDWSNVVAWQVKVVAAGGDTPTVIVNNLYLQGASYPDTSVGTGYDWRYTYYNSITQSESNPSPVMAVDGFPVDQPVELVPTDYSTDPQVTQIRWYRRGGTLSSNWYLLGAQPNLAPLSVVSVTSDAFGATAQFVMSGPTGLAVGDTVLVIGVTNNAFDGTFVVSALDGADSFTVPISTAGGGVTSSGGTVQAVFVDGQSDLEISTAPTLNLQNDVPVTTINEAGTILYGVPLAYIWGPFNGVTIFGDGDPNQPANLYWSNAGNPDGWGSLNFLQIPQPSDPLRLGVYWNGNAYARSVEFQAQIVPSNLPGFFAFNDVGSGESVLAPWAVLGGSTIPFMPWVGKSGIFIGTGGVGQSITDDRLWPLFDPASTRPDAVDWNYPQFCRLAWYDHHIYWIYQGKDGIRRGYTFNNLRGYWVGPHVWNFSPTCIFNQPEGVERLLLGGADGSLYLWDTSNSTDNGAAIPVLLQSQAYVPAGWENDGEFGHINVDSAAPPGGIAVSASFNATLSGYVAVGSAVSTSRSTTPMGLGDVYSIAASFQFQWSGPGTLFGFSVLWRNDGQKITHCETPATSYGSPYFSHVYRADICLRSTGVVNCTVVVDNVPLSPQPIPSTGNTRLRQPIFFPLNKGEVFQIKLDAAVTNQGFKVYASDSTIELMPWSGINPTLAQLPFVGGGDGQT